MRKAFLTSALGGFVKVEGRRVPAKLLGANGLLDMIRASWKADARVMFISGAPDDDVVNDGVMNIFREAFRLSGLSVSEILMCDRRSKEVIERLGETDVLVLAGGHVPTQNAFMKEIGLRERLARFDGLLIAWSAGSMNCADTVYAGPELPGEAIDPTFQRWIGGLGLTETNIFPHFEALRDDMLDGMRLIEDITFSDSMEHEIIALNNGSFIVIEDGVETLYGEAYSIINRVLRQICSHGESIVLRD